MPSLSLTILLLNVLGLVFLLSAIYVGFIKKRYPLAFGFALAGTALFLTGVLVTFVNL